MIGRLLRQLHPRARARGGVRVGHDTLPAEGFNRLAHCRYGPMLYNRNDLYIGRALEIYGEYCQGEADLLGRYLSPGSTVVDAGAHIGTMTLFLARTVGERGTVYAFEPQRIVFQTLCANLALNSLTQVHAFAAALGAMPGETTTDRADYRNPNNFGGMPLGDWADGERVPVVTLDSYGLGTCRLVKIDVEGMESEVLEGAARTIARCRPVLYVENDREEKAAALIGKVRALGYRPFWHLVPYFNPDNFRRCAENVFGDIVARNMLCLPEESGLEAPDGLVPA